jgi:hypothetical protein
LFEQKFYGLFEHMSIAFESTFVHRQQFFHAQSVAEGSIVLTIALALPLTIVQPQSVAEGSIVITLARLTLTILQAQSTRSRPHSVH